MLKQLLWEVLPVVPILYAVKVLVKHLTEAGVEVEPRFDLIS